MPARPAPKVRCCGYTIDTQGGLAMSGAFDVIMRIVTSLIGVLMILMGCDG